MHRKTGFTLVEVLLTLALIAMASTVVLSDTSQFFQSRDDRPDDKFWQVVTALGLTITPVLARMGHRIANRIEMRQSVAQDRSDDGISHDRTIIIGYGRVGRMVAAMLVTGLSSIGTGILGEIFPIRIAIAIVAGISGIASCSYLIGSMGLRRRLRNEMQLQST